MVATVMLLCKFGNYILSAPTTGINSALSCYPTQNISSPVIKEFKEQQDLGLTVWLLTTPAQQSRPHNLHCWDK